MSTVNKPIMKAFAQVISLVVISVVVIIIPPCGAALDEERLSKQAGIAREPRTVRSGGFIGKRKVEQGAEHEKQNKILRLSK